MDIAGMWRSWLKVITHPEEASFEDERLNPNATLGAALLYVIIAAVVAALISFAGTSLIMSSQMPMIGQMLEQAELPPEVKTQLSQWLTAGTMTGLAGVFSVVSIIWAPIGFLIVVGILHLFARMFGGNSEFGSYAYLIAIAQAPLSIISALVSLIPLMGACLVLILFVYRLVLAFYATKVAHSLSAGKAIAVLVIPVVAVLALGFCGIIALTTVIAVPTQ